MNYNPIYVKINVDVYICVHYDNYLEGYTPVSWSYFYDHTIHIVLPLFLQSNIRELSMLTHIDVLSSFVMALGILLHGYIIICFTIFLY